MHRILRYFPIFLAAMFIVTPLHAAKFNAYGLKLYTVETDHFHIHYHEGLGHLVKEVADKFESLYGIYTDLYHFPQPKKADIFLVDGDESNGFTFADLNFIVLWPHDFDYDMRGTHEWFNDVITHEYAHLVSIRSSLKLPPGIPYIEVGYFSYINQQNRVEALHIVPNEILPMWFAEGIAQYSSSRYGTDSWDTHRDMILRTLALSDRLISWDHMQLFAGRGDDFEKTYNSGFSLVKYISEKYGYDKIVAMCAACRTPYRFDFDGAIQKALGISGKQLYAEWKRSVTERYRQQVAAFGPLAVGRRINKDGFENCWPRFSPDGRKVYFVSNGKNEYQHTLLYSYNLRDSVKEKNKIKPEMAVHNFFDIHAASGRIAFTSAKSDKSVLPARRGGLPSLDLFIDTLPPEKEKFRLFPKKTERQVTEKQGVFSAVFSPTGNKLAVAQRHVDHFCLALVDTSGKNFRLLYPDTTDPAQKISFIYSLSWAPDGRRIALSYFDEKDRKIGIYDTLSKTMTVVCNTPADERDPFFSPDGKSLYFSSDRSGVFNIYRYTFETGSLEKLTNVRGGAFAPAVSPDNTKLVYAGYDSSGYGIYLLDNIVPLDRSTADSGVVSRPPLAPVAPMPITYPEPRPYSFMPRQLLCMPAIIAEQLVSTDRSVFSGQPTFKAGAILNLYDPAAWIGKGTELDGYFFMEPQHIYDFINLDHGGINIGRSYDAGLSGETQRLPLTTSFDYYIRGIAGKQPFYDEIEGTNSSMRYNIQLQNLDLLASHYFEGGDPTSGSGDNLALHLLAGLNRYDVSLETPEYGVFNYNLDKTFRAGAFATMEARARDSRSSISPRGIAGKLQYNFKRLFSMDEQNSFRVENGFLVENQDLFMYHEALAHVKAGIPSPWYGKHDIHLELYGDAIRSAHQDTLFPSFDLPAAWVPGYAFYYRGAKPDPLDTTRRKTFDTVLVTGNAVVSGGISYRFPLSPTLIDKRIWVIYLEKVYGCLNASGGVGAEHPSRLLEFRRNDWLLSYGAELRVQASTFNGYPLAVKLRWDNGIDRPAPIGGSRFTFSLGFDFDDWEYISLPDYHSPLAAAR